ncbi:transcriptional regulator [compost metagenome]
MPQTLADLAGHRLVHYGSGQGRSDPGFEYQLEDGSRALLPMAGALMVNDSETYLAAALAGLGIIQMPRVGVEGLLGRGELVSLLPRWQAPPLPIHALYAHRRQLAPRVQLFIHWLAELLARALVEGSEPAAP